VFTHDTLEAAPPQCADHPLPGDVRDPVVSEADEVLCRETGAPLVVARDDVDRRQLRLPGARDDGGDTGRRRAQCLGGRECADGDQSVDP
jgi:hypothetical protein